MQFISAMRVLAIVPVAGLLAACGGGGGGGCTRSSTLQLSYADYRIPATQTSYGSGNEWFASLERAGLNPRFGEVCGAATTFRVVSGTLPAGVTLDAGSGVITGFPTSTGEFTPTIGLRVAGFDGEATRGLSFVVDDFGITYYGTTTPPNSLGKPITPLQPTLDDGMRVDSAGFRDISNGKRGTLLPADATRSYNIVSGGLPPGVTLDPATGVVSGTPTLAGSYSATIRLTATRNGQVQTSNPDGHVSFFFQ